MFHDLVVAELVAAGHRVTHALEKPLQLGVKINPLLSGARNGPHEVVVTTQARVSAQIVSISTQTYTLTPDDLRLLQQTPELKTLNVVGQ